MTPLSLGFKFDSTLFVAIRVYRCKQNAFGIAFEYTLLLIVLDMYSAINDLNIIPERFYHMN